MSDITLKNIEALASGEDGNVKNCWQVVEWTGAGLSEWVTYCGECDAILCTNYSRASTCR